MALQRTPLGARGYILYADGVIVGARHHKPAVRREGDGVDSVKMASQRTPLGVRGTLGH